MKLIRNVDIITKDKVLKNHSLLVEDNKIKEISKRIDFSEEVDEIIDGDGGYLMPGFIDIHSDYIEQLAAPRVTSVMDFELALYEFEKELVAHGITTMYHSISLLKDIGKKVMRRPENVKKMIKEINKAHNQLHLVHHRFHLRLELDNIDGVDLVYDSINNNEIHLLSFMDHTPGQGQYRDLEIYKKSYIDDEGLSKEQVDNELKNRMNKEMITLDKVKEIASLALSKNIPIASHDDDTVEKLDLVKSFGATISEFPITLEILKAAREKELLTVVGAPNVLLGGSHAGNLSAKEAIESGCADIICSDYYPASILHTIFKMVEYGQSLPDMVKMATLNPAISVGIDHFVGSIEEGKNADFLIVKKLSNNFPAITHVMVDGVLVSKMNYRI